MTTAPSRPVKMAVTPVAVIRHVVARVSVLLCVSVMVFLYRVVFSLNHSIYQTP